MLYAKILSLILPWLVYLQGYMCTILDPKYFEMSDKTFEKQLIPPGSILNKVYLNKKTSPKFKCFAIEALVFLALNILYTIINIILLLCNLDVRIILKYITLPYMGIYLIESGMTILILMIKK